MVFSSTFFLFLFLPVVLILYYNPVIRNREFRNVFLLLASISFYAWGEPFFLFIMIISIILNWWFGLMVGNKPDENKKKYVVFAVVYNVGLLFVFKYLAFFAENMGVLLNKDDFEISIKLPIGISFFTFQMLSYVLDVYYKRVKAQKKILRVGLYVSMFPQLIAGPIVRYETIADEIECRNENFTGISKGICRFIFGLSKKVILANNLGKIADLSFNSYADIAISTAWIGAIAYTLQIYFDFSGYSDMAIGLGKMFGFNFPENFNYPYISKSITEFWRRWHISLSTWFRDCVYIPLGGNRVKKSRMIFNLFVVWSLTGIWHGANWTFLVWGLMYFVLLIVEKELLKQQRERKNWFVEVLKRLYTMLFVVIGWVIFRADNLPIAIQYIKKMFGFSSIGIANEQTYNILQNYTVVLILGMVACMPIKDYISNKLSNNRVAGVGYVALVMTLFLLSISLIVNSTYNPFIYFNF